MTTTITEHEFARICGGIQEDSDAILKHNPIGSRDETLLWMLLSCLVSYLSLGENETPCFTGRPSAGTYRDAIIFVLKERRGADFEVEPHLDRLLTK